MKTFIRNLTATLLAAAVVANVTLLWKMDKRLTRIETLLQMKEIAYAPR